MPEGRVGGWRWMLRNTDARRSTLRAVGVDVMRVKDDQGVDWCASVDLWSVGARFEARREARTAQ